VLETQQAQRIERDERMKPRLAGFLDKLLFQLRRGRPIVSPQHHLRRQVAHRAVRCIQGVRHFLAVHLVETGNRTRSGVRGPNAINAPKRAAGADIDFRQVGGWNPARVLDHIAIHVNDVQTAIGTRAHLHGAKPRIGRCQKLARFFAGGTMAGE
jgi:hypothetical protein